MSKKKKLEKAEFEMTTDQLEVLMYIIMDWRRLKSDLSEYAEYPNFSTTATKLVNFFHHVWTQTKEGKKK